MSYLLYCVVDGEQVELHSGGASIMIRRAGLGAVTAQVSPDDLVPNVDRLLAYARVIECYDRERSVIPMRFGCAFDSLAQVESLLESRQQEFLDLLSQLGDRTEMSARVTPHTSTTSRATERLKGASPRPSSEDTTKAPKNDGIVPGSRLSAASTAGMKYLAQRNSYYERKESSTRAHDDLCRRVLEFTDGTFVQWASEPAGSESSQATVLHFLVPRAGSSRLSEALRRFEAQTGDKVAISGPWPAYNFVSPQLKLCPNPIR